MLDLLLHMGFSSTIDFTLKTTHRGSRWILHGLRGPGVYVIH